MQTPCFNFLLDCSDQQVEEFRAIDMHPGAFIRLAWVDDWHTEWCWSVQTYLLLKQRGSLPIKCSNKLDPNAINIVHSHQLLRIKGDSSNFIVCTQADFPRRRWAHYHIVQNQAQVGAHCAFIPHWLQPEQIARNPQRKGVTRVAYVGQIWNGNFAGSIDEWKAVFEPHGIEFTTLDSNEWNNLGEIDVLVGIRTFNTNPHNTKPPSKLLNAWHGRIPFIGGFDSAFMQVGTPGKDYLVAKNLEEVLEAVLKLKANSKLYDDIVSNGAEKAKQYTTEKIAETWEAILSGEVVQRYNQWKSRPAFERARFSTLLGIGALEGKSKAMVKKLVKA